MLKYYVLIIKGKLIVTADRHVQYWGSKQKISTIYPYIYLVCMFMIKRNFDLLKYDYGFATLNLLIAILFLYTLDSDDFSKSADSTQNYMSEDSHGASVYSCVLEEERKNNN